MIYIITPCSRPENLGRIAESINIEKHRYRWLVVIDGIEPKKRPVYPVEAEIYYHVNPESVFGNSQRNFALDIVMEDRGDNIVYFLDDDTILHRDLFYNVNYGSGDFVHFNQIFPNGMFRVGGVVKKCMIDTGNVVFRADLIGSTRWNLHEYEADGQFIEDVYRKAQKIVYLNKAMSVYNALRPSGEPVVIINNVKPI